MSSPIEADCWLRPSFARRYTNTLVNGLATNVGVREYWFITLLAALQGIDYLRQGDAPIGSVLDVGCGPATRTIQLAGKLPGTRVVGIDYSPAMIEQAERINALLPPTQRVELMKETADFLPFADKEFDVSVCYGFLMCNPSPLASIREMLRVSKLGIVAIEESASFMSPEERGVHTSAVGATTSRFWHDYLSCFTEAGAKSVLYSIIPKPSTPNPPCMVRFIVPSPSA